MYKFVRLGLVAWIALFAFALAGYSPVAAAESTTICVADFIISITSPGDIESDEDRTRVEDSGVGGSFSSGFLANYPFKGLMDYEIDHETNTARLDGSFTATGPDGTITLPYRVYADMVTGAGTGRFDTADGTGRFDDFRWRGEITAQIINPSPTTFFATATGPCGYED
jgi:hypothetical protein